MCVVFSRPTEQPTVERINMETCPAGVVSALLVNPAFRLQGVVGFGRQLAAFAICDVKQP